MAQEQVTQERRTYRRRVHDKDEFDHDMPNEKKLDPVVLLQALNDVRNGDFSVRLPLNWSGMDGKIADAFNDYVARDEKLAKAVEQVSIIVGTEGKLGQRMVFEQMDGGWGVKVNSINSLIDNLVQP
ncbi:MAG: hypothetical protein ACXWIN_09215, partial [Burkholderiaceae bacterium]